MKKYEINRSFITEIFGRDETLQNRTEKLGKV